MTQPTLARVSPSEGMCWPTPPPRGCTCSERVRPLRRRGGRHTRRQSELTTCLALRRQGREPHVQGHLLALHAGGGGACSRARKGRRRSPPPHACAPGIAGRVQHHGGGHRRRQGLSARGGFRAAAGTEPLFSRPPLPTASLARGCAKTARTHTSNIPEHQRRSRVTSASPTSVWYPPSRPPPVSRHRRSSVHHPEADRTTHAPHSTSLCTAARRVHRCACTRLLRLSRLSLQPQQDEAHRVPLRSGRAHRRAAAVQRARRHRSAG